MERYIKCIKKWFTEDSELGKIYDTLDPFPKYLEFCKYETWKRVLDNERYNKSSNTWQSYFEPSTEKAYNEQKGIINPITLNTHEESLIKLLSEIK